MRGITDAPLGDAAFWLEETLALAAQIAAALPWLWLDTPPAEEQAAEEALFAAEDWLEPAELMRAAAGEAFAPAASRQTEHWTASEAAASERRERRPQASPGATHIVRREREQAAALTAGGTLRERQATPELDTAPAAAPDLLTEWLAAEPIQEFKTTPTAETLPPDKEAAADPWPEAGEVILPLQFYGLTAAAAAADSAPELTDILPGTALDETAAGDSRVMRQAAGGSESRLASPLPHLAGTAPADPAAAVDIDEVAEKVAERLQERLEIILQSRPFV